MLRFVSKFKNANILDPILVLYSKNTLKRSLPRHYLCKPCINNFSGFNPNKKFSKFPYHVFIAGMTCGLFGKWFLKKFGVFEYVYNSSSLKLNNISNPIETIFGNEKNSQVSHSEDNSPNFNGFSNRQTFNFVADAYEKVADGVISVFIYDSDKVDKNGNRTHKSNGTGFFVDQEGLIITNFHVVEAACNDCVYVKLLDGRKYQGKVVKVDRSLDLAIIKIEGSNFNVLSLGFSSDIKPGEFVFAVGTPHGMTDTVTSGIVSNCKRKISNQYLASELSFIQTDANVLHGSSGGPLFNIDAEVIGVVCSRLIKLYTLAIPIDVAKSFVSKYKQQLAMEASRESVTTFKYVGISLLPLSSSSVAKTKANLKSRQGVFVANVFPDSPAESGGLKREDIILSVNGKYLTNAKDFYTCLQTAETLKLKVSRGNSNLEIILNPEI